MPEPRFTIKRNVRLIFITFSSGLLDEYTTGKLNHHDVARIVSVSGDVALRELRRAGMDTSRSTRKRLQGARRVGVENLDETVAEMYKQGLSLRQIAQKLRLTQEGIRQILIRHGTRLRPRGARSPIINKAGHEAARKSFAGRLRKLRREEKPTADEREARLKKRKGPKRNPPRGLTRSELAARCDLTRAAIWSLEKALRVPTWSTLLKLSKGLNVGLEDLGVNASPPQDLDAPSK